MRDVRLCRGLTLACNHSHAITVLFQAIPPMTFGRGGILRPKSEVESVAQSETPNSSPAKAQPTRHSPHEVEFLLQVIRRGSQEWQVGAYSTWQGYSAIVFLSISMSSYFLLLFFKF